MSWYGGYNNYGGNSGGGYNGYNSNAGSGQICQLCLGRGGARAFVQENCPKCSGYGCRNCDSTGKVTVSVWVKCHRCSR